MDAIRTLNYSPAPSRSQLWYRRTVQLIIFLGSIAAAYFWGPPVYQRIQLFYWQYRCLTYTPRAGLVAFNFDLVKLREISPSKANADATQLGLSNGQMTTVFLHELRRPDGKRLIACVTVENVDQSVCWLSTEVMTPTFSNVRWPQIHSERYGFSFFSDAKRLRIFSGNIDPNNASHFTFDYDIDGHRHTIDGWLDNNERLMIASRP